jgi:phosphotransferase system HPr-like phosphotransfer protein
MTLNVKCGESVMIEIEGEDEDAAAMAIEKLFAEKFGEK